MTDRPPEEYHQRQRANYVVMGIVVAIVVGTVVLLVSLHQGIQRESCFAAGHHTCAQIDEDTGAAR